MRSWWVGAFRGGLEILVGFRVLGFRVVEISVGFRVVEISVGFRVLGFRVVDISVGFRVWNLECV